MGKRKIVEAEAAVQAPPNSVVQDMLDWFRTHPPVGDHMPAEDAVTLVRRMRDEDWAH
ncbi:MAG TPA: hypothetical protein VG889_13325 [Rhizomicrobium sp.]|nr:hypothetical protein [Rhizomicrobium sp.]